MVNICQSKQSGWFLIYLKIAHVINKPPISSNILITSFLVQSIFSFNFTRQNYHLTAPKSGPVQSFFLKKNYSSVASKCIRLIFNAMSSGSNTFSQRPRERICATLRVSREYYPLSTEQSLLCFLIKY